MADWCRGQPRAKFNRLLWIAGHTLYRLSSYQHNPPANLEVYGKKLQYSVADNEYYVDNGDGMIVVFDVYGNVVAPYAKGVK